MKAIDVRHAVNVFLGASTGRNVPCVRSRASGVVEHLFSLKIGPRRLVKRLNHLTHVCAGEHTRSRVKMVAVALLVAERNIDPDYVVCWLLKLLAQLELPDGDVRSERDVLWAAIHHRYFGDELFESEPKLSMDSMLYGVSALASRIPN